jgi:hypothetical protein
MAQLIHFLILHSALGLLLYHFGTTFGSIFRDYYGSGLNAVNGQSKHKDLYDAIITDRGAFFPDGKDTFITLPPNDNCKLLLSFPEEFSIFMWVYPLDTSGSSSANKTLFYRFSDYQNWFALSRNPQKSSTLFLISNHAEHITVFGSPNKFPACTA